ncbi:MAG: aldo/keto reductase [Kiritimatiellia bacterium]|nr:aldo/keto reductase [Lentisphaerota bacterium]
MTQSISFAEHYRPSALTLGTVQFGMEYGIANSSGRPDQRTVCDILACAAAGGVNCLDTAAAYGASEEVLGRALHDTGLAQAMIVVTKVQPIPPDLDVHAVAAFIEQSVTRSLQQLRLETLPLCLFHREQDYRYLDELCRLRARGLVRYTGVSADSLPQPARDMAAAGRVDALQLPMNIIDRRHEQSGVLDLAAERGLCVFVRSVYLQGLLLMPEKKVMPALADVLPVRRKLQQLAQEAGMGMDELAVRYILSLRGVSSVITGVETVEQMRRNAGLCARGGLPADMLADIRRMVPELPEFVLTPKLWPNAAHYRQQAAGRQLNQDTSDIPKEQSHE